MSPSHGPASQKRSVSRPSGGSTDPPPPALIGAAVDGTESGQDAAVLGSLLARATGGELMLITIHEEPLYPVVLPNGMSWAAIEAQARAMLVKTRDSVAPEARIVVHPDVLVWRGLRHVARLEHRDLLVVGSAHDARDGRVRLGKTAREASTHLDCPVAVAPRGMHAIEAPPLHRVGCGFQEEPEARAALSFTRSFAAAADADVTIVGVVNDRAPGGLRIEDTVLGGEGIVDAQLISLLQEERAAARMPQVHPADVQVASGDPAEKLIALSEEVDLLVIGSSCSGPAGRVQLGRTGRAVLEDAACPVIVVPRPAVAHG